MYVLVTYFVIVLSTLCCASQESPLLLLISFDGFRWNYLDRTSTPNFDKLIHNGVKAKWTEDVFVSQTFPNHYTLATGLYEESHGIVANKFFDPNLQREFSYHTKSVSESVWWGGEPIWVTSELQGIHSGVFFWVGSEAKIKNVRPTQWRKFNTSIPWKNRVDTVVSWLANKPTEQDKNVYNISLALLYFSQPDHYGHIYGPESEQVTEMIGKCDSITGYLIDQLTANGIFDKVNIIITSDHGFVSLSQNKTIPILPHFNIDEVQVLLNFGTGAAVWPKTGYLDSVFNDLKDFNPHAKVWKRDHIPKNFYYSNNDRIPPIFILPDDGWFLLNNTFDQLYENGSHGYNNSLMDMHPFFIAHGPDFRQNFISEPFSSVNVYELMCHLMKLKPSTNNGSIDAVKHLLRFTEKKNFTSFLIFHYPIGKFVGVAFGVVLGLAVVLFILVHFQQGRIKSEYKPLKNEVDTDVA